MGGKRIGGPHSPGNGLGGRVNETSVFCCASNHTQHTKGGQDVNFHMVVAPLDLEAAEMGGGTDGHWRSLVCNCKDFSYAGAK